MHFRLFVFLSALFCACLSAVSAQPILVSSRFDNGAGSLREAIATAAARGGANQIVFSNDLNGAVLQLQAASGPLVIAGQDLTIDASSLAHGLALDGRGSTRLFTVAAGATLTLQRLELIRGRATTGSGGAIQNAGTVRLTDCMLTENQASVDGGALAGGSFTLLNCTFFRNAAPDGAALALTAAGASTLTNCTISGNGATAELAGAITCTNGTLRLTHCTIAENTTAQLGGALSVAAPGDVTVERCIIAANFAAGSPSDIRFLSGNLVAVGPSLIGVNFSVAAVFPSGFLVGTVAEPRKAMLRPLGFYGGPTLTQPPATDSPALDQAGVSSQTLDQRGFPRPSGATADLGAVERGPLVSAGSQAALQDAINAAAPDTRIRVASLGNISATIAVPASRSVELEPVSQDAPLTFNGGNATRLFSVAAGASLAIQSATLTQGSAPGAAGGAVLNEGSLTLNDCHLEGCRAGAGGALSNRGRLAVNRCSLVANEATQQSGAIDHQAGRLLAVNVTLSGNRAFGLPGPGGALTAVGPGSLLTLDHCTFTQNTSATGPGGVLVVATAVLGLRNCILSGNLRTGVGVASDLSTLAGEIFTAGANLVSAGGGSVIGPVPLTGDANFAPLGFDLIARPSGLQTVFALGHLKAHRPLTGGVAIDAAAGPSPVYDQRGLPRPVGGAADLGAIERGPVVVVSSSSGFGAASSVPDTRVQFTAAAASAVVPVGLGLLSGQSIELDGGNLPGGIVIQPGGENLSGSIVGLNRVTVARSAGVRTRGVLYAVDSTFRDNDSNTVGVAVLGNGGTIELLRCSILDNRGIIAPVVAGGGSLTLTNCTLSGNYEGAIYGIGTSIRLLHCTISGNSGPAIRLANATARIERCILAGNSGPDFVLEPEGGTITAVGPNLIGSNAGFESTFPAGPLVGTAQAPLDPRLSPLVLAGGRTLVLLPHPASPALDAAGLSPLISDQRGFRRFGASDLGAVERGPVIAVSSAAEAGPGSLREALAAATEQDTQLVFAPELSGQTIALGTSGGFSIDGPRSVGLDASALPRGITLDGGDAVAILTVSGGASVLLERVHLQRGLGSAAGAGGLRISDSSVSLVECTLSGHTSSASGAALSAVSSVVDLLRCTLSGNSSADGSALLASGGKTALKLCTVANNTSALAAGLSVQGGLLELTESTVSGNTPGAGLACKSGATLILGGCIVAQNGSFDIQNSGGTVNPGASDNLIGNNLSVHTVFPVGRLVGFSQQPLDARLAPLADNGGPTQTLLTRADSPARERGSYRSSFRTDQRGQPRVVSSYVDLGSVEAGPGDPTLARLINVSTRLRTGTGDDVAIGGFVVTGGHKKVGVRVLGPTLAQFNVSGVLANPTVQMVRTADGATIAMNDNWQEDAVSAATLAAAGLGLPNSVECGAVQFLSPGSTYTAIVRGVGDTTGNCLVELYDLDPAGASRLTNLSTRGPVGTDDNVMIAGFVIGPGEPRKFLIRALGPTLTQFNVPAALQDPMLEVRDVATLLALNDDWQSTQSAEITASGFAPPNSREPAVILTLGQGSYTAIVRGKNRTVGNGLVEVYEVP